MLTDLGLVADTASCMTKSSVQPKILYIEDTPEARVLVRRILSPQYNLLEADNSLQGIEIAEEERPDLVLVDLHMPYLTGYEVATRLKSTMPHIPIVALSADVTENVRERVLASGCDGYIAKPIDLDTFVDQIRAYLDGSREELEDDRFREDYQQVLVARLEQKVRELTQTLERNRELDQQNLQLLDQARRQARLLQAAARVGQSITSILDLDELLAATVSIICDEFEFGFAGIFLVDDTNEWTILHEEKGTDPEHAHRLKVGDRSPVGQAALSGQAKVALDADAETTPLSDPQLPPMRSEIALPLKMGGEIIGALSVQSAKQNALEQEDIQTLQTLADQLVVAINNARLLRRLEATHQELVRIKTYEAIATATGEAIHWVGNKAAPIPASVGRIREDLSRYLVMANAVLASAPPQLREHKFAQMLTQATEDLAALGIDAQEAVSGLESRPLKRLKRMLNVESILEDLEIIHSSAQAILNIKEDLIGPARRQKREILPLPDVLNETIASMGIQGDVVRPLYAEQLPPVYADRAQLGRVFANLIKNAMEAMHDMEEKALLIWARPADEPGFVVVDIVDNGHGIPRDQMDKIWMAFYTTKGDRGGTGLGLPACAQIISELGGRILVESDMGFGSTFSVVLPALETDQSPRPPNA
jgi:signal transduction histidine kinase/DNA-binding response OmpR family regulator